MIKIVNAIFQSSASLERGENPVTKCQLPYGAQVEASFSMMNNIISDKASTMMISTYEVIQAVKYFLPAQEKTATQFFKRTDAVSSPVDKSLAAHMQRAYSRHKRKAIAAERDAQQGVKTQPQQPTKRKATSVMPCPLKRAKH